MVGGFDGTRQLASVERYDTENQVWDSVAPIKIARSALSLTVLDGKLYAMGGFDGHSFLSIVEFYDPIQNKWEESTPLTSGRSGHASAVIYQPSCANQYMDCVEDQIPRNRKSPEDDDSKPGPSNPGNFQSRSPSQPGTSSQLHAFSGNRCTHCDDVKTDTKQEPIKRRDSFCTENELSYERKCRDAIYQLMNQKEGSQDQCNNNKRVNSVTNTHMDTATDNEINSSIEIDNRKKFRRKSSHEMSIECSQDSSDSTADELNQLKLKKHTDTAQCSLSKFKCRVRQNLSDFVFRSSNRPSSAPLPKTIPQDSNSNSKNNLSNNSMDVRKCDFLKKYYKCKMKYCSTSK